MLSEALLAQFLPQIAEHVATYLSKARPTYTLHDSRVSRHVRIDPTKATLMFVIGFDATHIEAVFVPVTAEHTLDDIAHLVGVEADRAQYRGRRTIR